MPGLTLQQLDELLTRHPSFELEGLAVEFLEAFNVNEPLQQSDLDDWMENSERDRQPRDVLSAAHEAVACGWVEDSDKGLRITSGGKKKLRAVFQATSSDSAKG